MNRQLPISEKFGPLLNDACDGTLIETQIQELEAILESDATACKAFADHFQLLTDIRFLGQVERARNVGLAGVRATLPQAAPSSSPVPTLGFLTTTLHGTVGFFSSGWPVAYLVATAILGIALMIGSLVPVSQPEQLARQSVPLPSPLAPRPSVVGRITGMVDCRWMENPKSEIRNPKEIENQKSEIRNQKSLVALGDKFALASGLMEITYDTGAKVVLQGPVTYEVESAAGGYLSVGKLTARVEGRAASGEGRVAAVNHQSSIINHQSSNPQSLIPNPSPSTLHSPLFTIKTPTATVTDLGTEFGVEVGKDSSDVCVFAGSVEVATRYGNGKVANRILLTANGQRSVRSRVGDAAVTPIAVNPEAFVRVETFKAIARQQPQRVWIGNASFDDPKLEPKTVAQGGAPGIWTVERFGETDFGVVQRFNDHRQFFFWNEPNGFLRQRYLAHRVEAAGMVYTLRFRVATCNYGKCSVTARLLLNGEPPKDRCLRLELRHRPVDVNIAEFVDAKFVYVTTPSDVGKRVGIQFGFATLESWVQVFIGDVQLIVVPQADTPDGSGTDAEKVSLAPPATDGNPGTTARPTKEGGR